MNYREEEDGSFVFYDHHGTDHVRIAIDQTTAEHQTDDVPEAIRTLEYNVLQIVNLSGQKVNHRDIRTVLRKLVRNYFKQRRGQNTALHFAPDYSDGKERSRERLFRQYFNCSAKNEAYKFITNAPIDHMQEFVLGFIIRSDNPYFQDLCEILQHGSPHILLKLAV